MSRKLIFGMLATLLLLALLPFALVARSRASRSENLPVHLVMDMDKQSKYKPQRSSAMFADQRAMRPQVEGTLAQEDLELNAETLNDPTGPHPVDGAAHQVVLTDPAVFAAVMLGRVRPAGMSDDDFNKLAPPKDDAALAADAAFYLRAIPSPFKVTSDFIHRGQERFNIYCLPCHGMSGYGDGPVAQRASKLRVVPDAISGWVDPQNLHEAKILTRPDGFIFNVITNGIRSMPPYDKQISVPDRWAIVAYVRALQYSQNATFDDLTAEEKARWPK